MKREGVGAMAAEKKKKPKATVAEIKSDLLGDKSRAGALLSNHLRKIAQEVSELVNDPEEGSRMATKAEALARLMWKMALGYKEMDPKTNIETVVPPDRGMVGLIWDRIEGRAAASGDFADRKRSLPDRISDQSRNRLNNLTNDTTTKPSSQA